MRPRRKSRKNVIDIRAHRQKMTANEPDAKAILPKRGASKANSYQFWMQDHSKILEIRARGDKHNNCYFSLASALNHDYYYCLADKVANSSSYQNCDYYVCPQAFEKALDEMHSLS